MLWDMPWAVAVAVAQFSWARGWTVYAMIVGGALVFDFVAVFFSGLFVVGLDVDARNDFRLRALFGVEEECYSCRECARLGVFTGFARGGRDGIVHGEDGALMSIVAVK